MEPVIAKRGNSQEGIAGTFAGAWGAQKNGKKPVWEQKPGRKFSKPQEIARGSNDKKQCVLRKRGKSGKKVRMSRAQNNASSGGIKMGLRTMPATRRNESHKGGGGGLTQNKV